MPEHARNPAVQEAYALFERGEYSRCLDVLAGVVSDPDLLLRIRCYLCLAQAEHALALAERLQGEERWAFIGTAASRLGRQEHAEFAFMQGLADTHPGTPAHAELSYYLALHFWTIGEYAKSEKYLPGARHGRMLVRAMDLHAWNLLGQHKYAEHAAALHAALSESLKGHDIYQTGRIAYALSVMARERHIPESARLCEAALEKIGEKDDLRFEIFQTRRYIGWCKANDGDFFGAYHYLREALKGVLDYPLCRAWALADRAMLSYGLGYTLAGEEELAEARNFVRASDVESAGEERFVLLVLAELIAPTDVHAARAYLDLYHAITNPLSRMLLLAQDERRAAFENHAEGIVLRYEGKRKEAVDAIHAAWKFWTKAGFLWRKALASVELGELRNNKADMDCAQELMRQFPRSWITGRLHQRTKQWQIEAFHKLTKRQRDVLLAVCAGKTDAQLVAEWGVSSRYAVRNRLREVYEKFGVHTRAQLILECRKRGITN